jgi:hypothetical protein
MLKPDKEAGMSDWDVFAGQLLPVACPIGGSTPGQPVSAWPLSSLAGPPLAGSSLSLSGLRHLLRGVRLGDQVPGGIQHRLD